MMTAGCLRSSKPEMPQKWHGLENKKSTRGTEGEESIVRGATIRPGGGFKDRCRAVETGMRACPMDRSER